MYKAKYGETERTSEDRRGWEIERTGGVAGRLDVVHLLPKTNSTQGVWRNLALVVNLTKWVSLAYDKAFLSCQCVSGCNLWTQNYYFLRPNRGCWYWSAPRRVSDSAIEDRPPSVSGRVCIVHGNICQAAETYCILHKLNSLWIQSTVSGGCCLYRPLFLHPCCYWNQGVTP